MRKYLIALPIALLFSILVVYVPLIITKPPEGPVFTSRPGQIAWIGTATVTDGTLWFNKQIRETIFTDNFGLSITFVNPRNDYGGLYAGFNCRVQYRENWIIETFPWWDIPSAHHHRQWQLVGVQRLEK